MARLVRGRWPLRSRALLFALSRGRCSACGTEGKPWSPSEALGLQIQHILPQALSTRPRTFEKVVANIRTSKLGVLRPADVKRSVKNFVLVCPAHNAPFDESLVSALTRTQRSGVVFSDLTDWLQQRVWQMTAWRNRNDAYGELCGLSDLTTPKFERLWKKLRAFEDQVVAGRSLKALVRLLGSERSAYKNATGMRYLLRGLVEDSIGTRTGRQFGTVLDQRGCRPLIHGIRSWLSTLEADLLRFAEIEDALHCAIRVTGGLRFGTPSYPDDLDFYRRLSCSFRESARVIVQPAYPDALRNAEQLVEDAQGTLTLIYDQLDSVRSTPDDNLLKAIRATSRQGVRSCFDRLRASLEEGRE